MRSPSVLHSLVTSFPSNASSDMAYLDYKDQIRLALALYVVKHRGEKSIDEFVEEMRSRFKANRLGVPPSPRSSLTQIRTQPSIPSLLGLWNDRPFPLSDRRILELDIFLQEALSVHSGPDLVCAGSIIGLLMTINQTLYLRPVQDPPSSTSSVQSLKSLTLKLIRTLHVLLRLVLILPPSLSKLDFAETNPREIISCVYLILQTTLREVLPRLTLREVTTVCRFIGREVFSEVARALSDRMAGNMHRHEGNMSDGGTKVVDGIEKIGRNKSDGDVDDADDDNGGKETFPLLKLLYALVHLDSSLLAPLIRSLLSSLSSLFPSSPDFLSLSSDRSSRRWIQSRILEIDLFRDVLDLLLFAIRSTNDPFPLSSLSIHRRRQRRQSRLDHDQDIRTRSRRVGQTIRSIRHCSYGINASPRIEKQREDHKGEERVDEVEKNVEREENSEEEEEGEGEGDGDGDGNGDGDEDEEEKGGSIWLDLGQFCRRLHYITTRSNRAIHHADSDPNSGQQDLERLVSKFLEDVWMIEGDRSDQHCTS